MSHSSPLVSADLIWEIARKQNAYLVKRNTQGGLRFSCDPLNLTNTHSRKHAGFVNEKAVGIVPGEKGGVTLITKKQGSAQKPSASTKTTFSKSSRKTYKSVANHVAKSGYRGDLRAHAVARASAIRKSQQSVKESPAPKLRGGKAKKAAAESEE
ncbi:ribosomal L28e family protein [Calycina marina]|uniref:Ribosomal L28e family protein n=1 Tax=Calycina marina TaxID=1763456 RepID=A0A9P7YZI1_9HELO|nr:ribosomal L28e family protein [Calycina marina]